MSCFLTAEYWVSNFAYNVLLLPGHLATAAELFSLDLLNSEIAKSTALRFRNCFWLTDMDSDYDGHIEYYSRCCVFQRQFGDWNLKPKRVFRRPTKIWDTRGRDYSWFFRSEIIDIECSVLDDWRLKEWGLFMPELTWKKPLNFVDEEGHELVRFEDFRT